MSFRFRVCRGVESSRLPVHTFRLSRWSGMNCLGFLNQCFRCDKSPIYMGLSALRTGVSLTRHSGGDTTRRTRHREYLFGGELPFHSRQDAIIGDRTDGDSVQPATTLCSHWWYGWAERTCCNNRAFFAQIKSVVSLSRLLRPQQRQTSGPHEVPFAGHPCTAHNAFRQQRHTSDTERKTVVSALALGPSSE
jgi:hypothetical protein